MTITELRIAGKIRRSLVLSIRNILNLLTYLLTYLLIVVVIVVVVVVVRQVDLNPVIF